MSFASQTRFSEMKSIKACKVDDIDAIAKALTFDWAKQDGILTMHAEFLKTDKVPILDMYQCSENERHDDNSEGSKPTSLCPKLVNCLL